MSEGGEQQYADDGEKLSQQQHAVWGQQQQSQQGGRPRWLEPAASNGGEGQGKKGDGDGRDGVRQGMPIVHDAEDDSGLELCLGLSLGGSKGRSKTDSSGGDKLKDGGGGGSGKPGLNNFEPSTKNLARKEFGDGSDVKFGSLESAMRGSIMPGFDAWRAPAGEEEAKLALQHMAAMHAMEAGKALHMEQQQQQQGQSAGPKEEMPFYQDLQQGLAHNAAAAAMAFSSAMVWARYAQHAAANGGPPMQLVEPYGGKDGAAAAHAVPEAAPQMVLQPSGPSGSFPQGLHFEQSMPQPLQRQPSGVTAAELALQDANLDPQARQRLKNQAQAQRRQEARKKRKFQQEQKLQKKAKKEDEPRMGAPVGKPRACTPPAGTASSLPSSVKEASSPPDSQEGASAGSGGSGFRRMGSGSWSRACTGLAPDKTENGGPVGAGDQEGAGEQLQEIKRALQNSLKDRERASKDSKERDSGSLSAQSSLEDRKSSEQSHLQWLKVEETAWPLAAPEGGHDGARQPPTSANPPVNVVDMARLGPDGWFQKLMEAQMVNPGLQQAAMAAFMQEHAAAAPSSADHNQGQRRREPSERTTSAVDHERMRSSPENGVDRKGSPLRFDARSVDKSAAAKITLPATPFPGGVPMAGMPGVPPGFPPANFMHMPYPFPIPIPNAAAFPFPFPYMLQPTPGGPDAQLNGVRPMPGTNGSPFQLLVTPPGYAPFLNPELGTPWSQVVRPQAATVAAVSPPKALARTPSGMSEDEVARNQGSKTSDKTRSRSTSPPQEHTAGARGIPAPPTAASKQTGGAFASMRNGSMPSFSPPQFSRTTSETGERMLPREGSVGSAFASLTMSSEPPESGDSKAQVKGPNASRNHADATGQEESGGSAVTQLGTSGDAPKSDMERIGAGAGGGGMAPQNSDAKNSSNGHNSPLALAAAASEKGNQEGARIAPGVAPGECFGGTGNIPQLPWVQCTGAGPNGKTICGALYSFQKVIKIVCKCHGNHMTPAEFVQHAGGENVSNPEKAITVSHFSIPNQAAIAHG